MKLFERLFGKRSIDNYKANAVIQNKNDVSSDILLFTKILEQDPHNLQALKGLAAAYAMSNQFDDARQAINKILKIQPENIEIRKMYGTLYDQERLMRGKEMTEVDQSTARKLFDEATAFVKSGDMERAKQKFEQVLHLSPYNVDVEKKLALVYAMLASGDFNRGDENAAIMKLEKATQLDPFNIDHWVILVTGYAKVGNIIDAKQALDKAFEIDPTNSLVKQLKEVLARI